MTRRKPLLVRHGLDDLTQLGDEEALGSGAGGFGETLEKTFRVLERLLQLFDRVDLCEGRRDILPRERHARGDVLYLWTKLREHQTLGGRSGGACELAQESLNILERSLKLLDSIDELEHGNHIRPE